jgi:hypothetical protein
MDMIKRQNVESNIRWYLETQNGRANNEMRTCRDKARFQNENVADAGDIQGRQSNIYK